MNTREAQALATARRILATDPAGYRHSPPVEEPDLREPEDASDWECVAAAADEFWGKGA